MSDTTPDPAALREGHRRDSTDCGPDFCIDCSSAIGDWVQWPCTTIALLDRIAAAEDTLGKVRALADEYDRRAESSTGDRRLAFLANSARIRATLTPDRDTEAHA